MLAIIVSDYNKNITQKLYEGALARLQETGISEDMLKVIHVPGAVEIPLVAKLLAQTMAYKAIICLGAVIRGDTDHYDYVCQQVSSGCSEVMLAYNIPVIFGILTTQNEQQAIDRIGGKEGHKGIEAADTALAMVNVVEKIK